MDERAMALRGFNPPRCSSTPRSGRALPTLFCRTHDAGRGARPEPPVETQFEEFCGRMRSVEVMLAGEIPKKVLGRLSATATSRTTRTRRAGLLHRAP